MGWIIGILTAVLIIDCLFLILLVLIQLPKKEAGMGTAFGGGATDVLFGAGTGNALTKMTKYATGVFFVLTLSLSILNAQHARARKSEFEKQLQKVGKEAGLTAPASAPAAESAAFKFGRMYSKGERGEAFVCFPSEPISSVESVKFCQAIVRFSGMPSVPWLSTL